MRTHTKTFHIRLTEKEYERLCKYADKAGLPKTTYIRHMINGCCPKERPGMEYFDFMRAFYSLGNSLKQITHLALNYGNFHAAKLEQFYKQYIELLYIIKDRIIKPDDLDIPATLERGRQLAGSDNNEEDQAAEGQNL